MLVYTLISKTSDKVEVNHKGQYLLFNSAISAVKYMDESMLNESDFDVLPIDMGVTEIKL